jgi:hypothetical protein
MHKLLLYPDKDSRLAKLVGEYRNFLFLESSTWTVTKKQQAKKDRYTSLRHKKAIQCFDVLKIVFPFLNNPKFLIVLMNDRNGVCHFRINI